jgi:excisionase family DNA binding protein
MATPPRPAQPAPSPLLEVIEPLLSVPEAAKILGISQCTLRTWIQCKKITGVKVGGRMMFPPDTIREFTVSREAQQGKKPPVNDAAFERHYTVKEVPELWHLDAKMVRKIFANEPGVVSLGSGESRYRRPYRTLRIPESVMLAVHHRMRRVS